MISILPETEMALTPLLTASSFFSLLDTLEKRRRQHISSNYTTKRLTLRYDVKQKHTWVQSEPFEHTQ